MLCTNAFTSSLQPLRILSLFVEPGFAKLLTSFAIFLSAVACLYSTLSKFWTSLPNILYFVCNFSKTA